MHEDAHHALSTIQLVVAADRVHWYVIYGYEYDETSTQDDEEAKYTYLVHDVHEGAAITPTAEEFHQNLTEVLSVAA